MTIGQGIPSSAAPAAEPARDAPTPGAAFVRRGESAGTPGRCGARDDRGTGSLEGDEPDEIAQIQGRAESDILADIEAARRVLEIGLKRPRRSPPAL